MVDFGIALLGFVVIFLLLLVGFVLGLLASTYKEVLDKTGRRRRW